MKRENVKFGLSQITMEKISSVIERFPEVDEAIIYGSRAKGDYREGSDIDLTLIGNELDHDLLLTLMVELDTLMLPYKIDLSIQSQIKNNDLIEHIKRVGQRLYVRKDAEETI